MVKPGGWLDSGTIPQPSRRRKMEGGFLMNEHFERELRVQLEKPEFRRIYQEWREEFERRVFYNPGGMYVELAWRYAERLAEFFPPERRGFWSAFLPSWMFDSVKGDPAPGNIVLQRGKPGAKREPCYDEAFEIVARGNFTPEAYSGGFNWYCQQINLTRPDKRSRDSFKSAMSRRRKRATH